MTDEDFDDVSKCENCPEVSDRVRFFDKADVDLCPECALELGYRSEPKP